jgi:multidrug resistance protein, MATE family
VLDLLRLAMPVIIARAGIITMASVDTLMVGRYSAQELARLSLGTVPHGTLIAGGVGLLTGTIVMVAHALGAGRREECGAVWRRSIPYAVLVGLLFAVLCQFGPAFFRLAGQDPVLAEGGGAVLAIYGYGMPAAMLYVTTAFFLEGLRRPLPGMVAMIAANLLNVPLNWILIEGRLGLPAMGAAGSAWATTILRWGLAAGIVAYALCMRDARGFGARGGLAGWWRAGARSRRLGYAGGASQALESSAFMMLGLIAGWVGPLALGGYAIGLNLIALPFMAAVGMASATAVRVGEAHGREDPAGVAGAGWVGLGVTSAVLAVVAVFYALFPETIAAAFTKDADLLDLTAGLIAFSSFILVADGGQAVMANALRARGDAWMPAALHFLSYFAVMVPLSGVLAIALGRGVTGLFEGILVASLVSVGVLSLRFLVLARRDARPA